MTTRTPEEQAELAERLTDLLVSIEERIAREDAEAARRSA